jgi:hypothetical protein
VLSEIGCREVMQPTAAVAFSGARVAFYIHPAIGLLELVERPPPLVRSSDDESRLDALAD